MSDIISRADAVNTLETEIRCTDREEDVSGLTLAKLLISALPSADAVGVGRYENAMQKLREMPRYLNGVKEKQITKISADAEPKWGCTANFVAEQLERLKDMTDEERLKLLQTLFPSADAVHGEWQCKSLSTGEMFYGCSECGNLEINTSNFCPNCGAKMDGERREL